MTTMTALKIAPFAAWILWGVLVGAMFMLL